MIYKDPLSLREAAAILGVSHIRVKQLRVSGKLQADSNNKLSLAQVQTYKNENYEKDDIEDNSAEILQDARARKEQYAALMLELEYKEKAGQLVSVDEVVDDATLTANRLGEFLRTIPNRVAPLIKGKSEMEITEILSNEIELAIKTIHESRFVAEGNDRLSEASHETDRE